MIMRNFFPQDHSTTQSTDGIIICLDITDTVSKIRLNYLCLCCKFKTYSVDIIPSQWDRLECLYYCSLHHVWIITNTLSFCLIYQGANLFLNTSEQVFSTTICSCIHWCQMLFFWPFLNFYHLFMNMYTRVERKGGGVFF